MRSIIERPWTAFGVGLAAAGVLLLAWIIGAGVDRIGLVSFLLRLAHVFAAMLWIGMIWFVNFVQLPALAEADDAGRGTLMRLVVPRVALTFKHASSIVFLTGLLLLATSGYVLGSLVYSTAVHVPGARAYLMGAGALGGIAMWALVHHGILPSLRIVTSGAEAADRDAARAKIRIYARINLLLAGPVTFAMLAAAHLY